MDELERIGAISDPIERARAAHQRIGEIQAFVVQASRIRRQAITELLDSDMSQTDVAKALGVTRSRVNQLI
jgi:DNA-directed RNA polymerase specialized sigma subunit